MTTPPKIVVIGGGFAGMAVVRGLRSANAEVTLVDKRNFHLFQPLLYQVATGGLSPANIAAPLRSIFKHQRNVRVLLGEVVGFDLAQRSVHLSNGESLAYDYLVVAAGAVNHYYGHEARWAPRAIGLKTVEEATAIRAKVLMAFEEAERNPERAAEYLTFTVIGAGPTGVEMAGAIAELSRQTLRRDFRAINPATARVILIEGGPRVLPSFAEKLSGKALKALLALGVEVMLNTRVLDITDKALTLQANGQETTLPTWTIIWAAGIQASPLGKLLVAGAGGGVTVDRMGRVPVNPECQLAGFPEVFVIGDMAMCLGRDGKPVPGVAPAAVQQGQYVSKRLSRQLAGKSLPGPFRYWDKGSMATIGRSRAVAESAGFKISGWFAWLAWLLIHIVYLARFENRVLVMFQWFWNYITRNRTARLITGNNVEIKS